MLNQTLTVVYQNERIMVDKELLCKESSKIRQLMSQIETNDQDCCVKINYNRFTTRNVSNFLKICQNQETDVQNSELNEICLLAKMFQADKIFNTAFDFIVTEIDNTYSIPSDQLIEINKSQNITLEPEIREIAEPFRYDLSDFEFDESYEQNESNNSNQLKKKKEKTHSVCYQIQVENPFIKSHRFYLIKDNEVILMAKRKYDKIIIGKGKNCHFRGNMQAIVARIIRDPRGYNSISTNDQKFKIRFDKKGEKYSIKTSFDHRGEKQVWQSMKLKNPKIINGEYNHKAIHSRKNVILQNTRNRPAFIVRKIGKKVYETECHPDCEPAIAFSIALSQIIGPIA